MLFLKGANNIFKNLKHLIFKQNLRSGWFYIKDRWFKVNEKTFIHSYASFIKD